MHLNCHTYFSFKFGTMSPEELLREARQKGVSHLALTDINNTSGILDFFRLAKNYGIKPIAGIDFRNGAEQKFIGIAKNHKGFYEVNKFLSECSLSGETIIPDKIPGFENAFVIFPFVSAFRTLSENEFIGIKISDLNRLQFSEWKNHPGKLVLLHPVTFRNKTDFNTHRLLRAIDKNTLLSKLSVTEQAQPGEIMLTENELENKFHDYPFIIHNTKKISEQCFIDFEFGTNKNKKYFTGSHKKDHHQLLSLCYEGLKYRYNDPDEKIIERFEKEVDLITNLNFSSYFLINWDIVRYAQHKNYFYVGRGSGANSMVAYLLRITDVDPIDLNLYFERFINPSRTNPPDFDIDFSSKERDEIIKYIFEKHGTDHTALLATYSTFQSNAVIRELGKVFGLPNNEIDELQNRFQNNDATDKDTRLIFKYSKHIHDFPNHLSIHAGGILISEKPINYYTATVIPPKKFPLTQFSMLEAEDVGLYKFDILAQRGLGKIKDAVEIIRQNKNIDEDIHNVKRFKEDASIRENLRTANLIGCFYVESPAMRMLLTKLKASTYLDLVAASSIIRPGVAQSGMMREYILRFHDESKRDYIHPLMKELMEETFGVMVYQEDVIKVAHHFAKLTLTEADMLRRGMSGKYRGREEFKKVEDKFFSNCKDEGYPEHITKEVWRQIESFAGYAFSKGHSASYAVESYQCMFLKTYYPLEYMAAVINNGGGFYALEFYVHEARMCGGAIHAPDINKSESATVIYGKDIYLGYAHVQNLEKKVIENILDERWRNGAFTSLADFMKRVSIAVEQLRILIRIGAFRFTGRTKKQLLWDIHTEVGAAKKTTAKKELFVVEQKEYSLPELYHGKFDDAFDEMELLNFPLCSPFDLLAKNNFPSANGQRPTADSNKLVAADLKKHRGKIVEIIGYYVTSKHTQTKHKEHMMFGTFLDRDGYFFDTAHFPKIAAQFPFTGRGCYSIKGKVAEEFGFYSLDVVEMKRLNFISREEILEVQ